MNKIYLRSVSPQTLVNELHQTMIQDNTTKEISNNVRVSTQTVKKWEKGLHQKARVCNVIALFRLAKQHNCSCVSHLRDYIND